MFKTCGTIPIVFYSKGLNQRIFARVRALLEDYLAFLEKNHGKRYKELARTQKQPYLILCDRATEIGSTLVHPWHYACLVHETLGIKNNKVSLQSQETENKSKTRFAYFSEVDYDLDVAKDDFWRDSLNTPFPFVSENIAKKAEEWTKEYQEMGHKKISKETDATEATDNLVDAMDKVPQTVEKKKRYANQPLTPESTSTTTSSPSSSPKSKRGGSTSSRKSSSCSCRAGT